MCEYGDLCPLDGYGDHHHYSSDPAARRVGVTFVIPAEDGSLETDLFRRAALRWHPDLGPSSEYEERTATMSRINEARSRGDLETLRRLAEESDDGRPERDATPAP